MKGEKRLARYRTGASGIRPRVSMPLTLPRFFSLQHFVLSLIVKEMGLLATVPLSEMERMPLLEEPCAMSLLDSQRRRRRGVRGLRLTQLSPVAE